MNALYHVEADDIDPQLLADFNEVCNAATPDEQWVVTFGKRSYEEQSALHQKYLEGGNRAVAPEKSAHVGDNFPDGKARAIDFARLVNGKLLWDYHPNPNLGQRGHNPAFGNGEATNPPWAALIAAIRDHPRLHSLDHTPINDSDHVEKVAWQSDRG